MKPSPSAPAGATARPCSPEPPPDEGPALRVPGATHDTHPPSGGFVLHELAADPAR